MGVCDSKENSNNFSASKMVTEENNIKEDYQRENFRDNKFIPIDLINKAAKSVCKVICNLNGSNVKGTGFFMNIPDNSLKCLITNYHIISEKTKEIQIEIHNKKNINLILDVNNRFIQYFVDPLDITVIQIKDKEWDIIQNVEFLDYDMNYVVGYEQYKGSYIFALGYPYGDEIVSGSGKIINIKNNYEFEHNIPTDKGSSGSPIILLNISKVIKIIGVHKGESIKKMNAINIATFIGKIVDKIKTIRMKNYYELKKEKIDKTKKIKFMKIILRKKMIIILLQSLIFKIIT